MTDKLYQIAGEMLTSANDAYRHCVTLNDAGRHPESRLVQIWADTLRTAAEQVGEEANRIAERDASG